MEGKTHLGFIQLTHNALPYWGRLITDRDHKALPLILFVFMCIQFTMLMALYYMNNITVLIKWVKHSFIVFFFCTIRECKKWESWASKFLAGPVNLRVLLVLLASSKHYPNSNPACGKRIIVSDTLWCHVHLWSGINITRLKPGMLKVGMRIWWRQVKVCPACCRAPPAHVSKNHLLSFLSCM